MTLVAVLCDYMLHPFYPQFFEARFGVTDPKYVGYYFAAICAMVMISFPCWAYLSKRVAELNILVCTQFIAGILALYCYWTTSYLNFWIVSLIMILFKGSYLLVYPYILKTITRKEHTNTIGLLSVVVHLGSISGAVIGGIVVDFLDANNIYLIKAIGDFLLMATSIFLLTSNISKTKKEDASKNLPENQRSPKGFVLKLGLILLILYFSSASIRPFFSKYWEFLSVYDSKIISGSIYAIPGLMALIALWYNKSKSSKKGSYEGIMSSIFLGIIGLLLQGIPHEALVIAGRVIYGWAIFHIVVRMEVLLFTFSTKESYTTDYSKIHFFKNLGVLLSSFSIGILVDNYGLRIPFFTALIGFGITVSLYYIFFKTELKSNQKKLAKVS
ncbi:MFS transporter [Aquimarina hainanensis]|uniref:MFS transporter n=1 Tax=Aquimarina hainanensis TaxID=1578017 RepID=A0ABW5N9A3_9FLAO|nr:MFS transporter [Aquimarina sp. TRL1]QKX03684.1 MFS transporter [Aquimarina sp. TRL1]